MMTVEEIEAAMIEYEEKSALLPMPKNAEEHRDAVMMLDFSASKSGCRCSGRFLL